MGRYSPCRTYGTVFIPGYGPQGSYESGSKRPGDDKKSSLQRSARIDRKRRFEPKFKPAFSVEKYENIIFGKRKGRSLGGLLPH